MTGIPQGVRRSVTGRVILGTLAVVGTFGALGVLAIWFWKIALIGLVTLFVWAWYRGRR